MDGDEGFALIVSAAGAIAFVVTWYGSLVTVTRLGRGQWVRLPLGVTPAVCLIGLQYFLLTYAAHEVREEGQYDALFWLGGVAWLYLTTWFLRFAGLSARDDVLEMRNPAAAIAVCGAMAGLTICYAASNAGEGPTIWTTFVPACFGTGTIVLLWILVTAGAGIHEAIAVERDTAAGVRLAGFLVAAGLVLGRAVAGDWHTWEGTEQDFLEIAWPVLPLAIVLGTLQMLWRPTVGRPTHPVFTRGVLPALSMVLAAIAWAVASTKVFHLGGH